MTNRTHFVLIKREGLARDGRALSALESAKALVDGGVWPLWEHTRNRKSIGAGAKLAVYLAGHGGKVIATACARDVTPWSASLARRYPLVLDGVPGAAIHLQDVRMLPTPVQVRSRIGELSFLVGRNASKWGVAFMGGTRAVSEQDFRVLTTPARLPGVAVCIGCGCDDMHACEEGCWWLRVDREVQLGVCSSCATHVSRWDAGDRSLSEESLAEDL